MDCIFWSMQSRLGSLAINDRAGDRWLPVEAGCADSRAIKSLDKTYRRVNPCKIRTSGINGRFFGIGRKGAGCLDSQISPEAMTIFAQSL
jgi:hypothetical protein